MGERTALRSLGGLLLAAGVACTSSGPPIGVDPDAGAGADAGAVSPCAASDQDGDGFGTHPSCAVLDCDDRNAGIRPGAMEACNGLDEDCDGEIDEDLGDSWCGLGGCRHLVANCANGRPTSCEPLPNGTPEICNGQDDDCDGEVDEGLVGMACGLGVCERTQECVEGGWTTCTPGSPSAETCNGLDDNCDGVPDDGLSVIVENVSYIALSGHHPDCDGAVQRMGPACNAAFHRYCASKPCASSGFGPLENSGDVAVLACVAAVTRDVGYAELAARHPGCDGNGPSRRSGSDCNAAIHRYCASLGYVSGFGPSENSADRALVACLDRTVATVEVTSYTALSERHAGCTATSRIGPDCNAAISRYCGSIGYRTGYGPIENSGDTAVIACVRP